MAGARTMMRLAPAAVGRGWKLRSASALSWQCALFWQCVLSWQCVFWKPIYGHRRGGPALAPAGVRRGPD